ncbi:MAG: hypothetical protein ACJA15_001030 [Flavobacteriales bacterium]|jgi:ectoine hydroxylase
MAKLTDKYWGFFRRFKPAYHLFNLSKGSKLNRNRRLYKQYGIKKSVYAPISSADFKHLPDERPWSDTANDLTKMEGWMDLSPAIRASLEATWINGGYAILKSHFSDDFVDEVNAEVDTLMSNGAIDFNYSGKKIMFAYKEGERLGQIADDPEIMNALNFLAGKKMVPFQSINFTKSSEQRTHSDSIHMTSYPLGYLTAAWIALEDIGPDQGPLKYYPGSHKYPYVLNSNFDHGGSKYLLGEDAYLHYEDHIQKLLKEKQPEPAIFNPKKGDVFIWHANLLHGAVKMNQPELTRKSMVVHYFSPEVICYHELTQRPALIDYKEE